MTPEELSPTRILRVGLGFQAAKVLMVAVRLGIFAKLAEGPATLDELAAAADLHPRGARDFLDTLVALRFLDRDETGRYSNAPESAEFLEPGRPYYVGAMLALMERDEYQLWGQLTEALRDGRPRSTAATDRNVFEGLYSSAARVREFTAAMSAFNVLSAPRLASVFPWHEYDSFTDIGCAQGFLCAQIASRYDRIVGVGFDLPVIGPAFDEYVASQGLADRVRFQGGDFFVDPLPGTEVHVMGHILHNWDIEHKQRIIANSYRSLPAGGTVVVQEGFIDNERRANPRGLLMSLHMLLQTSGGQGATTDDCARWLAAAGFVDIRTVSLIGADWLVVGRKPGQPTMRR